MRPLVRKIDKKTMSETVEKLNNSIKPCPSFDFGIDKEEDDFWDWHFNTCTVCDKIWYMERPTCNGTTSEAVKLHNGLICPHCGSGYCSFEHMRPKILIDNDEEVNEMTGIKSCVIYKMCVSYLKHMTMNGHDDSFITDDSGYSTMFINGSISEDLDDIEMKSLRYALMNQDVEYSDKEHHLKEEVVRFIDEHFNDCKKYKELITHYNEYYSTDAKIIISAFVGCRNCLKC